MNKAGLTNMPKYLKDIVMDLDECVALPRLCKSHPAPVEESDFDSRDNGMAQSAVVIIGERRRYTHSRNNRLLG